MRRSGPEVGGTRTRRARYRRSAGWVTAAGLLAGFLLDRAVGDPRRWHPVAGFGRAAGRLETTLYAPTRRAGVAYVLLAVGAPTLAAATVDAALRRRPALRVAALAAVTWAALGGRSLGQEAGAIAAALERGDLTAARRRLPHLCGRDPSTLDGPELARAAVESVAENTSDAVVGPLVWGAVAGLPGVVAYRAANTLDAMVGHRSARYAHFGSAAARLDDLLNLGPSRLTAALTVLTAPLVAGSSPGAWRVWRRDGGRHPSPNSGQCEAAMAGALGVRLGGRNVYFGSSQLRPYLGDGRHPTARDVRRAVRLSAAVGLVAALAAGVARAARDRRCALR